MSQIKLLHSGGNGVILSAPTSNPASDTTFKLPQADGSANEVLKTDGSGNLSFVAQPTGGLANVVQFRTTQNQQQDNANQYEVLIHWEKTDNTGAGQIGSFSNPSTGVFTFPSTGIWRIDYNVMMISTSGSARYWKSLIMTTTNNSSYSIVTNAANVNHAGEYGTSSSSYIFDVTNVSTHKVRFDVFGQDGYVYYKGSTDENQTYVTFQKLGDT